MRTITEFPFETVEFPDMGIVMPDGCRLSARVWMPKNATNQPVPAILEYLPYRKRDGTAARDSLTHPYLAGHGYACLRVDIRGNGDSEGLMLDEYSEAELQDACDVIAWIVKQPWCAGKVGMMGISWGGFNSLQVAAMQPPGLEAIITLCSTDDRYADDIHYKGGLLLNENMGWGATMLSYSSRAPDPAIVGEKWREMWLQRLENEPFLPAVWLRHQTRDDYWKRGSICEDFSSIKAATLAIGGWGDAYKNAVPRLVAGIKAPVKGIIGPWVHKYPHFAVPLPAIGFLQEALRWWDRWLKGIETGVESDPAMRLYVMDSLPPRTWYTERPGRWIALENWPSADVSERILHLTGERRLTISAVAPLSVAVTSPADCGAAAGEYCAIWLGPEMPSDQRFDDAMSSCFDSEPLQETLDIVGAPVLRLSLSSNRNRAQIAVRLCDVNPSGASSRITYGVLNLCHHESDENPQALVPGRAFNISLQLDHIAWRVPSGHRLRISISSAYWPLVWPSPDVVTLTLHEGAIGLPIWQGKGDVGNLFEAPESAESWQIETIRPTSHKRWIEHDLVAGTTSLKIEDDMGEVRDIAHELESGGTAREVWSINPQYPLSARGEAVWTQSHRRGEWHLQTQTSCQLWSDDENFHLTGKIVASESGKPIFERDFTEIVPRGLI
jgi:uncharacterized protein